MKDDDRFPIPTEWLSDEAGMLTASVARWADREVVDKRHAHGEDIDALHAPAMASLMAQVGLQDLLWPEQGDEEDTTAVTCAAVLEQVGRADTGLGVALAATWALQRLVPAALKPHLGERELWRPWCCRASVVSEPASLLSRAPPPRGWSGPSRPLACMACAPR